MLYLTLNTINKCAESWNFSKIRRHTEFLASLGSKRAHSWLKRHSLGLDINRYISYVSLHLAMMRCFGININPKYISINSFHSASSCRSREIMHWTTKTKQKEAFHRCKLFKIHPETMFLTAKWYLMNFPFNARNSIQYTLSLRFVIHCIVAWYEKSRCAFIVLLAHINCC